MSRRSVAVVGAGIAGLATAWLLRDSYDVTLFEAGPRAGGPAETHTIDLDGQVIEVDCGFMVYNERNHPNSAGLLKALRMLHQRSDMTFGVAARDGALEYATGDLNRLFAQRSNLGRPGFWLMLRDIRRFHREAPALLDADSNEAVGDWLNRQGYGEPFVSDYLLPAGSAIWSVSQQRMREFPARHLARFFTNHDVLQLTGGPQWRWITGGAGRYVAAILAALSDVRLATPIIGVRRADAGVWLRTAQDGELRYDQAVLACHADESLKLLSDGSAYERAVLSAVPFQETITVLHTDTTLMPRRRLVWSAWNYLSNGPAQTRVSITYWMNQLQGITTAQPVLISLNPLRPPKPASIIFTCSCGQPQFSAGAMNAQALLAVLQGANGLWFAGAWTGWGSLEDGIASAVRVALGLGVAPPWLRQSDQMA